MGTVKKKATRAAIDQIENEIKQIDSIVNSWSSGRSLRFDPAHVRPRQQDQDHQEEQVVQQVRSTLFCFRVSFILNLFAFCFAIGFMVAQAITGLVPDRTFAWILTGALILIVSLNLILVTWSHTVTGKLMTTNQRLTAKQQRATGKGARAKP